MQAHKGRLALVMEEPVSLRNCGEYLAKRMDRCPAAVPNASRNASRAWLGVPDRWPDYSKARFRSDQHRAIGVPEGSAGYVVEVCGDACEVEVTEQGTGETLFLGAGPDADLALISGRGPVS